ncbi:MAG: AtpZ/AtpI family protein [Blautia sp.]|nr:AtpZ/AtpI family protein [Blautia sp.]
MKRRKGMDNSVVQSLAMVMQFGINMLVPICLMSALGVWLDRKFGTSFWMILLFFAGAAAGGQNVYRMAKQVYGGDKKELDKERGRSGENSGNTEKEK